ncbi:hypothetical protein JHK82_043468 [Glycine max]|nr:hypothetical protein JHK82_043468 [Glycine max]
MDLRKEYEDVEMEKAQATSNMESFVVGDVCPSFLCTGKSPVPHCKSYDNPCYFARWAATRKLLYQFRDVENNTDGDALIKKQILSLGAGFDPTYF